MDLSELLVSEKSLIACYEAEFLLASQRELSTDAISARNQPHSHSIGEHSPDVVKDTASTRYTTDSRSDSMDTSIISPLVNYRSTNGLERNQGFQTDDVQRLGRKRSHSKSCLAANGPVDCSLTFASHDYFPCKRVDSTLPEKTLSCRLGSNEDCNKRQCSIFDREM